MQASLLLCFGVEHIYETKYAVQIQNENREVKINMKRAVNNRKTIFFLIFSNLLIKPDHHWTSSTLSNDIYPL